MLEIKVPTSFSLWPSNNVTALAFKSVFLDHTPPNTHTWYFSIYSSMQPWNLINKPHFHTMHSSWCTLNVKLIRREKDGFCCRYSLAHPGAQPGTLCRARAACWWPLLGWEVENRTHREGCFSYKRRLSAVSQLPDTTGICQLVWSLWDPEANLACHGGMEHWEFKHLIAGA